MSEQALLAARVRPKTLDELVGQQQILGEGSALRRAIADDRVGSLILYGLPAAARRRSPASSPRPPMRRSSSCPR